MGDTVFVKRRAWCRKGCYPFSAEESFTRFNWVTRCGQDLHIGVWDSLRGLFMLCNDIVMWHHTRLCTTRLVCALLVRKMGRTGMHHGLGICYAYHYKHAWYSWNYDVSTAKPCASTPLRMIGHGFVRLWFRCDSARMRSGLRWWWQWVWWCGCTKLNMMVRGPNRWKTGEGISREDLAMVENWKNWWMKFLTWYMYV